MRRQQPNNKVVPSHSTAARSVAAFRGAKKFMNVTSKSKFRTSRVFVITVLLCMPILTNAQEQSPEDFSARDARSHQSGVRRMIHVERPPGHEVYVTLKVIVTPLGKVESATAISGPK